MTVRDLIEHLKTLPQDYEVWSNGGYYDYRDYPCDLENLRIDVRDKEKCVLLGENL